MTHIKYSSSFTCLNQISFDDNVSVPATHRKKPQRRKKTFKPGVFIEAGVHGREWITPAVATWILKELVKVNNTKSRFNFTMEKFNKKTVISIITLLILQSR